MPTQFRRFTLSLFLVAIVTVAVAAKPHYALTGKVVALADGDTLTVLDSANEQHKFGSPASTRLRRNRRSGPGLVKHWPQRFSARWFASK
jgi:hypothetical protein